MKYFTKEWYELCGKGCLSELLEDDERAAKYDEEYYKEVLSDSIGDAIALQNQISVMMNEDVEINIEDFEKDYIASVEANAEALKKELPEDVLSMIADMRVFAMNKSTKAVHKKLRAFCLDAQEKVEKTLSDYEKYYDTVSDKIPDEITDKMGFHDAVICSVERKENSIVFNFDISSSFATCSRIEFENPVFLEGEENIEGSTWLYDEIYLLDEGYEIHILVEKDDNLNYITLKASAIKF